MSQIGKKNFRHKLGNRSKKLSISKLRQQQADGEQEYQQLTNEINKYYDSLIDHIQQEREQIITELEKVFSTRAVDVKNRIDSTEIAPLLIYNLLHFWNTFSRKYIIQSRISTATLFY